MTNNADIKTDLDRMLTDLKRMDKDRRTIEKELKYAPFYIDQALSKGGNARFYNALTRYYETVMEETWRKSSEVREEEVHYKRAEPDIPACDVRVKATGNSMAPLIQNNAVVGGKRLEDASVIVYGEVYIIRTRNGMETIKYIQPAPGEAQNVLLVSLQESTPPTLIPRSEITELFHARFVINAL